ncbi:MAG: OFA family MFS transporter [Sporomusaceae bacterium]|nr:OFA family MFS transporter [Sporomusaceae bacterium]
MSFQETLLRWRPWIVLAAATGVNLSMGLNYSWSVIQKALVSDWHWTLVQASLPYTAYAVVITVAMLLSGKLQKLLGPRQAIRLGAVLMGLGLISCSFSQTPLLIACAYSFAALGAGICYSTTLPTVIAWFPAAKKGLVTGVVISGSGLAPIYVSFIANWLLLQYGISRTFLLLGIGVACLLLFMTLFITKAPALAATAPVKTARFDPEAAAFHSGTSAFSWREMISTTLFWRLWFMYLFASSAGLMIIGHIAMIAKKQAQWDQAIYLVLLIALFNTLGRVAAGFFSDRFALLNLMKGIFAVLAMDLLFFASYETPLSLCAGAALLAFCYGTCPALFPLAVAEFFGVKNLSINYGVLFTAWGGAALIGPIVAGQVVDWTGGYLYAYLLSAGFMAVACALTFGIRQKALVTEANVLYSEK